GKGKLQSVELSSGQRITADLLITAIGWTAPTSLLNMAGDKPYYESGAARFLPGGTDEGVYAAGGIAGDVTVQQFHQYGAYVDACALHYALPICGRLNSSTEVGYNHPDDLAPASGPDTERYRRTDRTDESRPACQ